MIRGGVPFVLESEPGARARSVLSKLIAAALQVVGLAVLASLSLARVEPPEPPLPSIRWITGRAEARPVPRAPSTRGPQRVRRGPRLTNTLRSFLAPTAIPDRLDDREPDAPPGIGVEGGVDDDVPGGAEEWVAEPTDPSVLEPVRPGRGVRPPRRVFYVPPVYPEAARRARIEGTVVLEAVLDSEGGVTKLRVAASPPLLDRAALDAVSQWRYEPTLLNGVAVPILMTVTVEFRLTR